jgi:hypothetical protein
MMMIFAFSVDLVHIFAGTTYVMRLIGINMDNRPILIIAYLGVGYCSYYVSLKCVYRANFLVIWAKGTVELQTCKYQQNLKESGAGN